MEWREVFEGYYAISENGDLKRLIGGKGYRAGRIIKWFIGRNGYKYYIGQMNCVLSRRSAHSLVAEAFVGPRQAGNHVHHIDHDKLNNHYSNLMYVTPSQNSRYALIAGAKKTGESLKSSKLTNDKVAYIRENYPEVSMREMARRFGVCKTLIGNVIHRRAWKHV